MCKKVGWLAKLLETTVVCLFASSVSRIYIQRERESWYMRFESRLITIIVLFFF